MVEPVPCAQPGCGHGFPEHRPGGGCAEPCPCPGFRWVPARGPAAGYDRPPGVAWADDGQLRTSVQPT